MPKLPLSLAVLALAGGGALSGCSAPQPVTMAPPIPQQPAIVQNAPMGNSSGGFDDPNPPVSDAPMQNGQDGNRASGNVFNWNDIPQNQRIGITRGVFDQGGYQLFAQNGDTIVVPFVNQNLYAMKFGQSVDGTTYFLNDGAAPTLFLPRGGYLENAGAQGAKWYPFSQNFAYSRPVYIGIAPSWADYMAMGWYSGMLYRGGYWGYSPWSPGFGYSPMVGLNFNIGGRPYNGWNSYQNYYRSNPYNRVYVNVGPRFNYNSVGRRSGSSFSANGGGRRSSGSFGSGNYSRNGSYTGAFGGSAETYNRSRPNSAGGFGQPRTSSNSNNTFGTAANRPSGSFGGSGGLFGGRQSGGSQSGGSFGSSTSSPRSGSFGSSGSTSGFGSSGRSRGSFGSGSSGYSRPSGSWFGSGSSSGSSGSSFGSGRRSGGSSFGGGRRSGGSFGGGRRR